MKTYIVKLGFIGIVGQYFSDVEVKARNEKSAIKKAERVIGNRDGWVVLVREAV